MGLFQLVSIYDTYWEKLLKEIQNLLKDARENGKSKEIDVGGLTKVGERENWYGAVVVSKFMVKSDMAHTKSLGNVLVKKGILNNFENTVFRLVVSEQLKLHAELSLLHANKDAYRKQITTTEPEKLLTESIIQAGDLGEFYHLIREFERDLRKFMEEMLGKSYLKMLENDLPEIVKRWKEREDMDRRWGLDPDKDLISYADLTDYMQIIKKYRRIFAESEEESNDVVTYFKIFAINGRNPVMHFRPLTTQMYHTAKGAEKFLREWIRRRTEKRGLSLNP